MKNYKDVYKFFGITAVLLFCISFYNFIFFYTIIGLFTIFIGVMIFVIASNSKLYVKRSSILIIGIAYLFVGILDLMHIFTSEGVLLLGFSVNQSFQFLTSARMLEAFTLFFVIAIPTIHLKMKQWNIYLVYCIYTLFFVMIISYGNILPEFFSKINGQTTIRSYIEILIIIIFGVGLIFLFKSNLSKEYKRILSVTLILKMISELLFILNSGTLEILIVLGLLAKYLSYGGIYIIYILETLNAPYTNIFHLYKSKELELINKAEIDQLTGLFNHSTTYNKVEEAIKKIGKTYEKVTLMMLDIDDFKIINDTHGHLKGDEILNRIGTIFNVCEDYEKIVGRYGGDEFVILLPDCDVAETIKKGNKLRGAMEKISNEIGFNVTCSMGAVIWEDGDNATDLIRKADMKMYESKRKEKGSLSIWEKEYSKRA